MNYSSISPHLSQRRNFIFDCLSPLMRLWVIDGQGLTMEWCVLGWGWHGGHSTGWANEPLLFHGITIKHHWTLSMCCINMWQEILAALPMSERGMPWAQVKDQTSQGAVLIFTINITSFTLSKFYSVSQRSKTKRLLRAPQTIKVCNLSGKYIILTNRKL